MIVFAQLVAAGLPLMAAHEAAWWENWAAVGAAKEQVARSFAAWAAAEQAMHACPVYQRRRKGGCTCHRKAVEDAHAAYMAAVPLVEPAEQVFKAGVRREQLPSSWPEEGF